MPFHPASSLARLIETPVRPGVVVWIGARPARREAMRAEPVALLAAGRGLVGDRYANAGGARQLTLIEAESLAAIASHLGRERVDGEDVRRNVVVRGINLSRSRAGAFASARRCSRRAANAIRARAWKRSSAPAATTRCAASAASPRA